MRGIVIETNGRIYAAELRKPLYRSAARILDGYFEIVRPRGMKGPYCFLANEAGLLQGLPVNKLGSWLYQSHLHGHPIVGNIIILKEEKYDLVSLDPDEIRTITAEMELLQTCLDAQDLLREETPL